MNISAFSISLLLLALHICIDYSVRWTKDNHSETVVVSFSRKNNSSFIFYGISDFKIKTQRAMRDLGILIDSNLVFYEQVKCVVSKAIETNSILTKNSFNFAPFIDGAVPKLRNA